MYCIDRGISDLTRLEQDQIDDYVGKAKEVPLINNRYHQIVDKVQRILFVQSKEIDWEANVIWSVFSWMRLVMIPPGR